MSSFVDEENLFSGNYDPFRTNWELE